MIYIISKRSILQHFGGGCSNLRGICGSSISSLDGCQVWDIVCGKLPLWGLFWAEFQGSPLGHPMTPLVVIKICHKLCDTGESHLWGVSALRDWNVLYVYTHVYLYMYIHYITLHDITGYDITLHYIHTCLVNDMIAALKKRSRGLSVKHLIVSCEL